MGVVPVFRQRFALEGEHRCVAGSNGCGGVILRGVDVARGPAYFCAQCCQCFDQHGGLDSHVQRACNARALQWLGRSVFLANCHQAGHFSFGNGDFLAAKSSLVDVGDLVIGKFAHDLLLHSR
jgi:hypothetical protein